MRPAAEILTIEGEAIRPLLESLPDDAFDMPTVCDGWTVRDVLAHCSSALMRLVTGALHDFSPGANEVDVEERRSWDLRSVLDELHLNYRDGAAAIDRAGGPLDGIGLGEWIHGGDVRDAIGRRDAYESAGIHLVVDLLIERSVRQSAPRVDVVIGSNRYFFGTGPGTPGRLETDAAAFVRLCGNRRPDTDRYALVGADAADLVLFT